MSKEKTQYIGLRISVPETGDNVIEWLNEFMLENSYDDIQIFGVFEHKGVQDNVYLNLHYHFMLLDISYTEAFRKKIGRFFEKKDEIYKPKQRGKRLIKGGNYDTLEKGFFYLCKGQEQEIPKVVMNDELLSQEEIVEYHKWYWGSSGKYDIKRLSADTIKDEQEKDNGQKDKKKQVNKVIEFKQYYERDCLPRVAERGYRFKYDEIIDDILDFFKNKDMLFRQQLVEQYLNLVFNCYVREYQYAHFKRFKAQIADSLRYNAYFEEFYKFID